MRKTIKTARCRPTKCRNCKKILVVGRRNAEKRWKLSVVGRRNVEFAKKRSLSMDENEKEVKKRLSSVDESEKTAKSIHHPRMKVKIYPKALVIRGWNAENAKNCPSSVDESEKTAKSRNNENNPRLRSNALESRNRMDRKDIGQELPTNVHTLIFQHTAYVFLRVKFDSTGFNFSNNTRHMFFCVLIRLC